MPPPTVLYKVDDLVEVLLLSFPSTWAYGSTTKNVDIAVIGIAEKCSPVNAGIVFFRKENFPTFQGQANSIKEAISRILARRERIVADAWEHHFPSPTDTHPLGIEARWLMETMCAPFLDTPLCMAQAGSAADYVAIWAILSSIMHHVGFPTRDGKFNKAAYVGSLAPSVSHMRPEITAWAGILFEKVSLATLAAFQTPHAQIRLLPGDLGFMITDMPVEHLCQTAPPPTSRHLPPLNVHGYGAKRKANLPWLTSLATWLDLPQVLSPGGF